VARLGLDDGDSDPVRFWRYALAALDQARPGIAGPLGPLLGPPAPSSFEGLVTALINELAGDSGADEVLLVLDDYHQVDSWPVHESVAFLLESLPPGLRVVMAGRADPPLPLARLRAVASWLSCAPATSASLLKRRRRCSARRPGLACRPHWRRR
jgi:LuxR family transcriptional regulator, maltose regulon positive regulatory protein